MVLCRKAKFDQKNRILIPVEMMEAAGGFPNCMVYVTHDEGTHEVKLVFRNCNGKDAKENGKG